MEKNNRHVLVGTLASLVVIIAFVTGRSSLPDFFRKDPAQPPTPPPSHSAPLRTETAIPAPTATPTTEVRGLVPLAPPANPSVTAEAQRIAPFTIALQGCNHSGGGLTCDLLIENTDAKPAYLALVQAATVAFADGGECRLRGATLGGQRWSEPATFESGIPLLAQLYFGSVPTEADSGTLKFTAMVLPKLGRQTRSGPSWDAQSILFRSINFH